VGRNRQRLKHGWIPIRHGQVDRKARFRSAPIDEAGYAWRTAEDGGLLMLRATAVGIARVTEGVGAPAASGPIGAVTETPAERTGTEAGGAGRRTIHPRTICLTTRPSRPSTPRGPE
jgi:hypothetical protein